jgi:hypothetical protein
LIVGNPATAERYLREGYGAFRAMSGQGYFSILAALVAEALYAQGRFDEAQRMTEPSSRG